MKGDIDRFKDPMWCAELERQNRELQERIAADAERIRELENKYEQLDIEHEAAMLNWNEVITQRNAAEAEIARLQAEVAEYKGQAQLYHKDMMIVREQRDNSRAENTRLTAALGQYQRQLGELVVLSLQLYVDLEIHDICSGIKIKYRDGAPYADLTYTAPDPPAAERGCTQAPTDPEARDVGEHIPDCDCPECSGIQGPKALRAAHPTNADVEELVRACKRWSENQCRCNVGDALTCGVCGVNFGDFAVADEVWNFSGLSGLACPSCVMSAVLIRLMQ